MPKGIPHKRYTPEFKKHVVETMRGEHPSYKETEWQLVLPYIRAAAYPDQIPRMFSQRPGIQGSLKDRHVLDTAVTLMLTAKIFHA